MTDEINVAIKGLVELKEDVDKATEIFRLAMEKFNTDATGYKGSARGNAKTVEKCGLEQLQKLSGYYELMATVETQSMLSIMECDDELSKQICNNIISGEYKLYIPGVEQS